jgi:predicted ATPase
MRIAVSGTHRSGKSTLLEELSSALPKCDTVAEPYEMLSEDGYEFADPPIREDFEAQLEHAIETLNEAGPEVLFDRCPIDFLAYIQSIEDGDACDLDDWLPAVREAVERLDLIVFVPLEESDRIRHRDVDHDPALRRTVDAKLREMLLEDSLGFGATTIEVHGSVAQRATQVLERIRAMK